MRLKNVSLADFSSNLQKKTGVHFEVAQNIKDRKITAIFHDRPVAEVMDKVQDLLFVTWKTSGSGYVLSLPHEVQLQEDVLLQAEDRAEQAKVLEALNGYAKIYDMPGAERRTKGREAALEVFALEKDPSPEAQAKLGAARDRYFLYQYPQGAPIGKVYAASGQTAVESLFQGQTLFASNLSGENGPRLPDDSDNFLSIPGEPTSIVTLLRLDRSKMALQAMAASIPKDGSTGLSFLFDFEPNLTSDPDVRNSKLLALLASWNGLKDDTLLSRGLPGPRPKVASPGYFNHRLTLADQLEFIADQADIPVIADAFRLTCTSESYLGSLTVKSYLDDLAKGMRAEDPKLGYYRTDGDWILARHRKFWQKLGNEVSERDLAPMEKVTQAGQLPTADDYSALVSKLDARQRVYMSGECPDIALRFDHAPFVAAFQSLMLWSQLNSDQREAVLSVGLPIGRLTREQQNEALNVFVDTLWKGRLPKEFWPDLFKGQLGKDGALLRCLMTNTAKERAVNFNYALPGKSQIGQGFVLSVQQHG